MGPRAGLDRCGKSRPTGIRFPDRPARNQSLYRLRYPAYVKMALSCGKKESPRNAQTDCISSNGGKNGKEEDHVKDGGTRLEMIEI